MTMPDFNIVVNGNDFEVVPELNEFDQMVNAIDKADDFAKINKLLHQLSDAQKGIDYDF